MPADDDAFPSGLRGRILLIIVLPLFALANLYRWRPKASAAARSRSTVPWWRRVTAVLALPIGLAHHVLYDDVGNRFSSRYTSRLTKRPVRYAPALVVFTAVYLVVLLGFVAAIGLGVYRLVT